MTDTIFLIGKDTDEFTIFDLRMTNKRFTAETQRKEENKIVSFKIN